MEKLNEVGGQRTLEKHFCSIIFFCFKILFLPGKIQIEDPIPSQCDHQGLLAKAICKFLLHPKKN
jgi:hypothetical protein